MMFLLNCKFQRWSFEGSFLCWLSCEENKGRGRCKALHRHLSKSPGWWWITFPSSINTLHLHSSSPTAYTCENTEQQKAQDKTSNELWHNTVFHSNPKPPVGNVIFTKARVLKYPQDFFTILHKKVLCNMGYLIQTMRYYRKPKFEEPLDL